MAEADAMAAAVWHVTTILRRDDSGTGTAQAARAAHDLFNASLVLTPAKLAITCRKGCASCCHSWVGVTAPEVFLLADGIRAAAKRIGASTIGEILARCERASGFSIEERFGAKIPCALLRDEMCSLHAIRPTVCRQVSSTDLAACLDEFEGRREGGDVPVSAVYIDHGRNARIVLLAALQAAGLSRKTYELNGALARALTIDGAERRWRAGEDIFAGVDEAPVEPVQVETLIGALVARVAAARRQAEGQ
jgi:hypothetical protein